MIEQETNPHTQYIKNRYKGEIITAYMIFNDSDSDITNISGGEKYDDWNDQHIAIFCQQGGFRVYTKNGIVKKKFGNLAEADRDIFYKDCGFGWTPKQWPPERLYLFWEPKSIYYCSTPNGYDDMIKPLGWDDKFSWNKINSEQSAIYNLTLRQEAFMPMGSGTIDGESIAGPCIIPPGSTFEAEGQHYVAILTDKRA
jgi:hypothetical protein